MADPWKRRVEIGDCVLYEGDCLEVMPTLGAVDAVVTDPPYGIDPDGNGYGRAGRSIRNDYNTEIMGAGVRAGWALVAKGMAAVFYSSRITPRVMGGLPAVDYYGEIVWDKKAPGMGGCLRYQHENIALFSKNGATPAQPVFSVLRHYRAGDVHPHEKPLALMWDICSVIGGDIALDPFMGSGTTLVACAKLGRRGIGIELDPDYFDIACKRVEEAYRQPDLFIEPPKKPEQTGMDV